MSTTLIEENPSPKIDGKTKKGKGLDISRFEGPGINFKAKLIGIEDVPEPRGDKMCQVAMAKLKAAVTAIGEHKTKITVNISLEGLKIYDEKQETVLHAHPVHRVSFIARENNDSRAFGYVFNREDGVHQYFGIKTEKSAEALVLCMRDLFQACFQLKKEQTEGETKTPDGDTTTSTSSSSTDGSEADAKNKENEQSATNQPSKPVENNLLNLDADLQSLNQGINMVEVAPSASSNAWLESTMLLGNQPLGLQQTVPAMASPFGAQQQFLQQAMMTQNRQATPTFGTFPGSVQPVNQSVGTTMYPPGWQTPPGMSVGVPNIAARPQLGLPPQNQSWMVFDSSSHGGDLFKSDPFFSSTPTPAAGRPSSFDISSVQANGTSASNIFTDSSMFATKTSGMSSSNITSSPQLDNAFSVTPLQPIPAPNSNVPLVNPDPFAELTSLSHSMTKKVTKEDFTKEPPKPTLLDLAADPSKLSGVSYPTIVPIAGPIGPSAFYIPSPDSQMATFGSLDKLHTFDYHSAHKFSALNDKRSLSNAPVIQWPTAQTPPPIPTRSMEDKSFESVAVPRPRPRSSAGASVSPLNAKSTNPFAADNPFA